MSEALLRLDYSEQRFLESLLERKATRLRNALKNHKGTDYDRARVAGDRDSAEELLRRVQMPEQGPWA